MSGGWDDCDRFYVGLTRVTLARMKMKTPGVGTLHHPCATEQYRLYSEYRDLTEEATSYYKFGGFQFGHALSEYCTVKGMCYICPRSVAKSHSICGRAESSRV
jgi:hypothetical protein